jgi:hypothetical protein
MTANVVNQMAYIRTSREFPQEPRQLSVELTKSYLDIANAVNTRTIGMFPTLRPAITGESFFLAGNLRQQSLRQVYTFGAIAAGASISIPYFIESFTQFSHIYGTCITTLPDYRPIPFAAIAANANIAVRVAPTTTTTGNIIVANGAAGQPIASGIIILEWLSNV